MSQDHTMRKTSNSAIYCTPAAATV